MTKRRKLTPGITAKEIKYKLSLKKIFWAPSPNYEKILDELAKKGSEEAVEEKQFLNNMKLIDRPGGVSGMDMVTYKKNQACAKRKAEEAFSASKRRERESSWQEKMNTSVQVDSSTDDDEDDQDSGDEYTVDYEPKNKTVTLDISKKALRNAALAAEKNSISNRGAAEFTAALVTGGGTSIDNLPISKSNFNKHKTKAREEKAFDIKESDLEMLRDKDGLWVIHWDGKTLKKLQHSGENSEHVAVVMKALHTDK